MDTTIGSVATLAAVLFAIVAVVLLSMDRPVASGTFFVLTAFAIYVRETRG